jgi:hypothetical protein
MTAYSIFISRLSFSAERRLPLDTFGVGIGIGIAIAVVSVLLDIDSDSDTDPDGFLFAAIVETEPARKETCIMRRPNA